MIDANQTDVKAYCNRLAIEKGLDPAGYASSFEDGVLIEIPLPWKKTLYEKANPLPQEAIDLREVWLKHYYETGEYSHNALFIAPDPAYSRPGFRSVIYYSRKAGQIAAFDKIEYSVPEAEFGALIWALFQDRDNLPKFEAYRTPENDHVRDLLVCTHGTVDAACAKFGYPLYNYLRRNHADENLRVWRVSHFGGHVFAPTLLDMPTGHYWAYVEQSQAQQIAELSGDVAAMRGHYRGWAGLADGFIQSAERELWQKYGWDWFKWQKSGEVLSQDAKKDDPSWAEIRITFASPDGTQKGIVEARVEVKSRIETISTTGYDHTYAYPQYTVTHMEHKA